MKLAPVFRMYAADAASRAGSWRSIATEYSSVRGVRVPGSSARLIRGLTTETGVVYPPVAASYAMVLVGVTPGWTGLSSPVSTPWLKRP